MKELRIVEQEIVSEQEAVEVNFVISDLPRSNPAIRRAPATSHFSIILQLIFVQEFLNPFAVSSRRHMHNSNNTIQSVLVVPVNDEIIRRTTF